MFDTPSPLLNVNVFSCTYSLSWRCGSQHCSSVHGREASAQVGVRHWESQVYWPNNMLNKWLICQKKKKKIPVNIFWPSGTRANPCDSVHFLLSLQTHCPLRLCPNSGSAFVKVHFLRYTERSFKGHTHMHLPSNKMRRPSHCRISWLRSLDVSVLPLDNPSHFVFLFEYQQYFRWGRRRELLVGV